MKLRAAFFLITFLVSVSPHAQDAVVKIYTERSTGTSQGSGFFTNKNGQIVTAYHVVEGGKRISIFHETLGSFTDIIVEFIAPEYDLAVLRVSNIIGSSPYLVLNDQLPNLKRGQTNYLNIRGFPRGGVLQQFQALPTTSSWFVNSHTIRDARQRRLFKGEIDVIPLDASVYSGMSGGPVIGNNGVVGVISGSYDEGGGLSWAMPSKYLKSLTEIGKKPNAFTWPRLTLMASSWRNLRASVVINADANAVFSRFIDDSETLARILGEMYDLAGKVYINLAAHRPFLEQVISNPIYRNNWKKTDSFLKPTGGQAFGSLRTLTKLQGEYAEVGRQYAVTSAGLFAWVLSDNGLTYQQQQHLGREMRNIRSQIADLKHGMDVYLGINTQRVISATPALIQGLKETSGQPVEQARVQLAFLDAWLPAIKKYSSPSAVVFMTRAVSANRQIAKLFEPIVYKVN